MRLVTEGDPQRSVKSRAAQNARGGLDVERAWDRHRATNYWRAPRAICRLERSIASAKEFRRDRARGNVAHIAGPQRTRVQCVAIAAQPMSAPVPLSIYPCAMVGIRCRAIRRDRRSPSRLTARFGSSLAPCRAPHRRGRLCAKRGFALHHSTQILPKCSPLS